MALLGSVLECCVLCQAFNPPAVSLLSRLVSLAFLRTRGVGINQIQVCSHVCVGTDDLALSQHLNEERPVLNRQRLNGVDELDDFWVLVLDSLGARPKRDLTKPSGEITVIKGADTTGSVLSIFFD